MLCFEFPLNERVRTLLRLEDLFCKFLSNIQESEAHHHHSAMLSLFQIMDVMDRGDLKNDLMQELEKHKAMLAFFRTNPKIDAAKLDETFDLVNLQVDQLRTLATKPVQELKQNEWLMNIKQRAVIPGGLCEFDLPSYHFWLNQTVQKRQQELQHWIDPIYPIYQALALILKLLRNSAEAESIDAENGTFQLMLGTNKAAQMVRIELDDGLCCYPEISANKYAIHVRFMRIDEQRHACACQQLVNFKLTLASL